MTDSEWPTLPQPLPELTPPLPEEPNAPLPQPLPEEPSASETPTPPLPEEPSASEASRRAPTCPDCGAPIDPAAWYCEACGNPLIPTAPAPAPAQTPPADAPSTQTRRLGARVSHLTSCPVCGGTVGSDGYCQTCGAKAPRARDHFTATPAEWVGGVCDRGVQHHRNEDAMALWAQDGRAVLVVCDGVSTSIDSDVAAMAAAEKARDVLVERLGGADLDDAAMAGALVAATAEANAAVVATTAADSTNAASATFAAAVVVGDRVHYANLGDSRVYFIGGAQQQLLSVDDSMAQAFIAEGMAREEAEALPRAHAITKWLGRDSLDIVPRTGVLAVPEPGWLVVCSDGLWNYASAPEELAAQVVEAAADAGDPTTTAQHLVTWATAQGGHDNITVALARVPAPVPEPASPTLGAAVPREPKEQPDHG